MISLPPAIKRWATVTSTCLRTKQCLILTIICLLKLYPSNCKIDPKTISPYVHWIWNLLMTSAVLKWTWMRTLLKLNQSFKKLLHQLTRMNMLLCPPWTPNRLKTAPNPSNRPFKDPQRVFHQHQQNMVTHRLVLPEESEPHSNINLSV